MFCRTLRPPLLQRRMIQSRGQKAILIWVNTVIYIMYYYIYVNAHIILLLCVYGSKCVVCISVFVHLYNFFCKAVVIVNLKQKFKKFSHQNRNWIKNTKRELKTIETVILVLELRTGRRAQDTHSQCFNTINPVLWEEKRISSVATPLHRYS